MTLISLAWLFIIVTLFVVIFGDNLISWLQYLYYFSYIKLGVTIIKYIPQVSFCTKSTTSRAYPRSVSVLLLQHQVHTPGQNLYFSYIKLAVTIIKCIPQVSTTSTYQCKLLYNQSVVMLTNMQVASRFSCLMES